MTKAEYTGDGEETTVLSYEMQQRVQALRAARRILERHTSYPNGGIYSMPTIEPGDTIDLHSLASWIITGKDPWAAPPRDDGMPAWAIEELLDRLRDRGWIHDEPKGEDVVADWVKDEPDAPEPADVEPLGNHFLARLFEQQLALSHENDPPRDATDPDSLHVADHAVAPDVYAPTATKEWLARLGEEQAKIEQITATWRQNRDATDPDSLTEEDQAAWYTRAYREQEAARRLVDAEHVAAADIERAALADDEAVLNWRQPDPITPDERERMAADASIWLKENPGVPERMLADVEKDDVPIPFIQTEAGRAAVKQAYSDLVGEALKSPDAIRMVEDEETDLPGLPADFS